jgi:hypothetical protein
VLAAGWHFKAATVYVFLKETYTIATDNKADGTVGTADMSSVIFAI